MEGGRRRGERSAPAESTVTQDGVWEGDDNREEGMEKFYALIANIRAIRDSLRRSERKRMRKEAAKPVWKPRFEMEDFMREDDEEGSSRSAIRQRRGENDKSGEVGEGEEEEEEGKSSSLDLSLSL